MKKLVMTLFIACFAVMFANAQDAPKKATSFGWNKASLTEIGCDADQIKKIAAIKKEASEKKQEIEADATLDEKGKKAAIKTATKARNEAMMAILNDEQKKKVEEINLKLKEEAKAAAGN
jgi:flagellar motor protein MotB